jgi:hypothetical protein
MKTHSIALLAAVAVLAFATPATAQPFLEFGSVPGEDSPPPPPPPPSEAPTATPGQNVSNGRGQTGVGLIVPAVQRDRGSRARAAAAAPTAVTTNGQGLVPEQPVCGHCGADILTQQAATTDGLLIIRHATEPQPAPTPSTGTGLMPEMPVCGHCGADIPAQQSAATDGLLPVRYATAPQADALTDGLMILRANEAEAAPIPPTGTGLMPELPICGHCGADVARPTAAAATPAPAPTTAPPRQRRGFSLSIGGVTLSSTSGVSVDVGAIVTGGGNDTQAQPASRGGVRVASGDVNGDGQSARRRRN